MLEADPVLPELPGQLHEGLGGLGDRIEHDHLGSEMHVQAHQVQPGPPGGVAAHRPRLLERDAELAASMPGGNVVVASARRCRG